MKKKRGAGGVIVLILIVAVFVGAFVLIMRYAPRSAEDTTKVSELDTLLNIDVAGSYPSTPREVMKLYNRYIICLYGEGSDAITDGQMQALGAKLRVMYDEALLEKNPQETNFENLILELGSFREDKKTIIQANVCGSNEVEYVKAKGGSGAFVEVSYFMRYDNDTKERFRRTYQRFLLRKDADGNWKILGFEQVDRPAEGEE